MLKWIRKLTRVEIVLLYLVILAGSIVRMTGSGMGCPDWPKCFGYLIPPTDRAQLIWEPQREFKKGQIIILDESLKVARNDFKAGDTYTASNWSDYTKHDYAQFNVFHTWTEYVNRLLGALSGAPMLLLFVLTLLTIRKNAKLFLLSTAGMILLGFEAWLGKLVVDGNLIPGSITIHMMGALLVVAAMLLQLGLLTPKYISTNPVSGQVKALMWLALLLSLVQIIMGTQVREQIDVIEKAGAARNSWISQLDWQFYAHRSFSILVVLVNVVLWYRIKKIHSRFMPALRIILGLIGLEIVLGMILAYLDVPKLAQPAHLLLGAFLFGLQCYMVIKASGVGSLVVDNVHSTE